MVERKKPASGSLKAAIDAAKGARRASAPAKTAKPKAEKKASRPAKPVQNEAAEADDLMSARGPTYPVHTIAKLLMISERRVQQLTKEGVIPKAERGRYELAPAVQGYIQFLQERSLRTDTSPIDYHVEKARLTKNQADLAEVEAAKARAEVADIDAITRVWSGLCAETRVRFRNIPARVVSSLVGSTDEREIKAVLMREIDQVLDDMADFDPVIEDTEGDNSQTEDE